MKKILENAYNKAIKFANEAKAADYIPELANEDIHKAGVVLIDKKGNKFEQGEVEKRFSIQSISKVITYLLVLENCSEQKINQTFGIKPTAFPFNSVLDLELAGGKPRNPLVNAGAMAATALLYEKFKEKTFDIILEKVGALSGNLEINYSESVFTSERDTAFNNRALINLMVARGIINDKLPINEVANTYFKTCSIMVNTKELGNLSGVISNDGVDLINQKRIFEEKFGRILRTVMAMGGMYNYSGEFALEVGLPAKSGVGGGIITASKNGVGLATYCPGLDEFGNSLVGGKMLKYISEDLDLGVY